MVGKLQQTGMSITSHPRPGAMANAHTELLATKVDSSSPSQCLSFCNQATVEMTVHAGAPQDNEGQIMCIETNRGHKRIYRRLERNGDGWDGFDVTDDKVHPLTQAQTFAQTLQGESNITQCSCY